MDNNNVILLVLFAFACGYVASQIQTEAYRRRLVKASDDMIAAVDQILKRYTGKSYEEAVAEAKAKFEQEMRKQNDQ